MKQTSLFVQYVSKFFSGVVAAIVNKINDSKNPLVYYHKRFLKKQYSPDGKWESITAANTLVMADVVAMDSSLPLKKRDSISRASGDIPKMGMEMALREKQLTDLRTLALRPETEAQLITRIFNDVPRVIGGVYERNEAIFLEALLPAWQKLQTQKTLVHLSGWITVIYPQTGQALPLYGQVHRLHH